MLKLLSLFLVASISLQAELSLEEKVGQLLMVHVASLDDAKVLIQDAHVGGVIYFRALNSLERYEDVRAFSQELQSLATIPLLIAVDQEGGRVTHLRGEFTHPPCNWDVGLTGEPVEAEKIAFMIGSELGAVGINMNLAPVVDVNTNPLNPVIGNRSFSSLPEEVVRFAKAALTGYKKAGIISTVKHFPGHGDTAKDSHHDLPVVNKPKEQLFAEELLPFAQLAADADVIMSAHLLVPALDDTNPATFSPLILQNLLRDELGFTGVIISDSLVMEGALKMATSVENAAITALNAGCDILLIAGGFMRKELAEPAAILRVHKALVEAVESGQISQERLDQAVDRILTLKKFA